MERDFTNCNINPLKWFGGANGNKISIEYEGNPYMLKFPTHPQRNREKSYTNGCISEYVGCHIIQTLNLPVQETLLGTYRGKVVVACKDFERNGYEFQDFAHLKNTMIDSGHEGYGTELSEVLDTIQTQQVIAPEKLEQFFWNMFIADSFLGNFDRHNGNWGFLINRAKAAVKIAPIFDCGSCLYPQMPEKAMRDILDSRKEIEERVYTFPTSAIKENGKKINYVEFLLTTENEGCLSALKRISARIDIKKINQIIDDTPYISDIHKLFLKTMLKERKELIIDRALKRLRDREQERGLSRAFGCEIRIKHDIKHDVSIEENKDPGWEIIKFSEEHDLEP